MRSAGLVSRSIPGERLLFRVFNAIGETLPSMALARQAVGARQGTLAGSGPGRRRVASPTGWHRWCSRSPSRCSPAIARRAVRWCSPPPRRTTSSSRSPTGSGSTTSSPPGTGRRRRRHLRRHARRPVRVVGGQARRRPRVGRASTTSTSPRATPTPTASYDTPLLSAVGYPIVVNPDPRMVGHRQRPGAGRCSTSTCRPV